MTSKILMKNGVRGKTTVLQIVCDNPGLLRLLFEKKILNFKTKLSEEKTFLDYLVENNLKEEIQYLMTDFSITLDSKDKAALKAIPTTQSSINGNSSLLLLSKPTVPNSKKPNSPKKET